MEYKIEKVEKVSIRETILPDGEYKGRWNGFIISLRHDNEYYELETNVGVKGMCDVSIFVAGGEIMFNVLPPKGLI